MGQIALRPKSGKVEDAALALERLVPQDIVASVKACSGHFSTHLPQLMQRWALKAISGSTFQDSMFWHQRQRKGQPLKKTRLRIPGPS